MSISDTPNRPGAQGTPDDTEKPLELITPGGSEILRVGWFIMWRFYLLIPVVFMLIGLVLFIAGFTLEDYENSEALYWFLVALVLPGWMLILVWILRMAHRKRFEQFQLHYVSHRGEVMTPDTGAFMRVAWLLLWRAVLIREAVRWLTNFAFPFGGGGFVRWAIGWIVAFGIVFLVVRWALDKKYANFRLVPVRNTARTLLGEPL